MSLCISFLDSVEYLMNLEAVDEIYVRFNVNREVSDCNLTNLIAITNSEVTLDNLSDKVPIEFVCEFDEVSENLNDSFLLWSSHEEEEYNLINNLKKCVDMIKDELGYDVEELMLFDTYESECGYSKDLVLFVRFTDESRLFFEDCDEVSTKISLEFPNLSLTMLYQDRGGVRLWKRSSPY